MKSRRGKSFAFRLCFFAGAAQIFLYFLFLLFSVGSFSVNFTAIGRHDNDCMTQHEDDTRRLSEFTISGKVSVFTRVNRL